MRHSNKAAFDQHLASSAPHHLSRIYLICAGDDFERKQAIDAVLSYVLTPDAFVSRFSGGDAAPRQIIDALESPALFGGETIVVVDEVDKKFIDALAPSFAGPLSSGYLLFGSKSKIGAGFCDAQGVVLDLTEEKPWDKEKRWTEMLHEKARAAGKRLTPDAALWMIERLDRDLTLLSREMDKLLCFTAGKSTIDRLDVETICSASRIYSLWMIAEDLVWKKVFQGNWMDMRDASFFHGLIASLRQQLMIGLKIHLLEQSRVPFSEWNKHLPKIWPKTLEKKAHMANQLGFDYFRKGLDLLFEIEMLSKSGTVPMDALFDLFCLRCAV